MAYIVADPYSNKPTEYRNRRIHPRLRLIAITIPQDTHLEARGISEDVLVQEIKSFFRLTKGDGGFVRDEME